MNRTANYSISIGRGHTIKKTVVTIGKFTEQELKEYREQINKPKVG